ncbi:DUF1624 domain-containing protein [Chryseosolibacter indicus]|uniref:DUF1624 domain-containing protein n=1 Tax=Chryseosolibacter indicus TaxID=2782351 RepID=A0ABS5VXW7_9BACT|nr:heparan-alpha-glucosaminide N-acetyltransferase domain-containing protein [Chryseosolibacter indicus]MBT1706255.1 DUF1624 domain-containing protein [Chryseosolibacter indicus]
MRTTNNRLSSIDFVRGVVMIIMTLDHVRDLLHVDSLTQSPTNLATTSPLLFFTRWITYFCAPVFVFLAGTSAYLSARNQNDVSKCRNGLIKRGFWLIIIDITVLNFGLYFDIKFHTVLFEVLASIGIGFIVLAFVVKIQPRVIGALGLITIITHNLFQLIPFKDESSLKLIISPLFNVLVLPLGDNRVLLSVYPPIPWLGVMLCGFAMGKTFTSLTPYKRKRLYINIGLACLAVFICLRYSNLYGDPLLWSHQKNVLFTVLSFLNVSKYPPSLLFCLVTLGGMFVLLAFSETMENKVSKIVANYGKVPFFYFLLHFYFIHLVLLSVLFLQGFTWQDLSFSTGTFGRPKDAQSGVDLPMIYVLWIGVLMVLYMPCVWFANFKAKHSYWWLKYL